MVNTWGPTMHQLRKLGHNMPAIFRDPANSCDELESHLTPCFGAAGFFLMTEAALDGPQHYEIWS